jgi:predicted Zn-dependent peptidase
LLEVLPKDLIPALNAFNELIMHPEFAAPSIILEKKIISLERAMRTVPGNTFFLYLNELTEEQLEGMVDNINREDLLKYHQQFYRSDNITVMVAGSFNPTEIIRLFTNNPAPGAKLAMNAESLLLQETYNDVTLNDYLQGEKYQLLYGFDLKELSKKELLVAKVLPFIFSFEARQYDHLSGRPLDYQLFLFNLSKNYYLIFQYRDCLAKYSPEMEAWHQKNLVRYFKYLEANNFNKFFTLLAESYDKFFEILGYNATALNEYYDKSLYDPVTISSSDVSGIRSLTTSDVKAFVRKYLQGKNYHKIVINAL